MDESGILEQRFVELIASDLGCSAGQVSAADALLAAGCEVPFVARYRRDATGGLGFEQLATLARRRRYFQKLQERAAAITASIAEQEKLTSELAAEIAAADNHRALDDIFLPYRPDGDSRARAAREKKLEPLADALLKSAPTPRPSASVARRFVKAEHGVKDTTEALQGARDVLAARLAETAGNRARLRSAFAESAVIKVGVKYGKDAEAADYRDFFHYSELDERVEGL